MVMYRPNNSDKMVRRMWFWSCAVLTPVVAYFINVMIASAIKVPTRYSAYLYAAAIGAGAAFVIFILLGLLLSKVMPSSKLSTWF